MLDGGIGFRGDRLSHHNCLFDLIKLVECYVHLGNCGKSYGKILMVADMMTLSPWVVNFIRFLGAYFLICIWNLHFHLSAFHLRMKFVVFCVLLIMGGDRCRIKPITSDEKKANNLVWDILEKGGVTLFMLTLHDFDSQVL